MKNRKQGLILWILLTLWFFNSSVQAAEIGGMVGVAEGSANSGQPGVKALCSVIATTAALPSYTASQLFPLSCDEFGNLRIRAYNGPKVYTNILNQTSIAGDQVYSTSIFKMADIGANGGKLRVIFTGTTDADLHWQLYETGNDCTTLDLHQTGRGIIHTPRAGFGRHATIYFPSSAPCAMFKFYTEATIPSGSPTIVADVMPLNMSSFPTMGPDMSFGTYDLGTAEFGRWRGGYSFSNDIFSQTVAAGQCIATIANNTTGNAIRIALLKVKFHSIWNAAATDADGMVRAVRLVRITADNALTALTPQPDDQVFMPARGTYRAGVGAACTAIGTPYHTFWMAFSPDGPTQDEWVPPIEQVGKITIRPNERIGLIVVGNGLVPNNLATFGWEVAEEP